LSTRLQAGGITRTSSGKVRDTYYLNDDRLLVVATDRISIFDFVLNALVPQKGEVLTALTHFWLTEVLYNFKHHLIKSDQSEYNAAHDLQGGPFTDLPLERCLVVKNLSGCVWPFEMIYRHHIGGSIYKKYLETGMAGGQVITPNLPQWSKLDKPIFTPSTKEDVGHDVNVDADYFFRHMEEGGVRYAHEVANMLAEAYAIAYAYAEQKGILILDTKFETAAGIIIDEIITPDSSRFVLKEDWEDAMEKRRSPDFHDKQPVRDLFMKVMTPFLNKKDGSPITGINNLDPENNEHVTFVHGLEVPEEIISGTTKRYLDIFERITGRALADYQRNAMGV